MYIIDITILERLLMSSSGKKVNSSPCPQARKCGGCQLLNMKYEEQLSWKMARCIKLLGSFGRVSEIIGMENPYHYRNKVQAAFQLTRSGAIISGVYQAGTHNVVKVDSCLTEDEKADEIIVAIRKMLPEFNILPYNEDSGKGFLRHVLVKRGFATNQIMVVLVGASVRFPMKNRIAQELCRRFPEITTVVFNINPGKTSMVLGERSEVLYGSGYIEDILCGCTFRISAKSFYQINPIQTERLYSTAMDYAQLSRGTTVIDAYCGTGTIGLIAAKSAGSVVGVELNGDAVKDAKANAKLNGIENAQFVKGDAGEFMQAMADEGEKADVVFMDPPRAGSDERFLKSLIRLSPERVIYISCNPETLARDLRFLTTHGYKVRRIQPVDMFPHTNHVESVVLLVKLPPDDVVNIELDLTKLPVSIHDGDATYDEIKKYVLSHHGLKVSSLYISQIKRKYGLKVTEAYNKPKSENSHQPQCPPEKEKAITDALTYFKMI